MTATLNQTPGDLNINVGLGDSLSRLLTFTQNAAPLVLTGYTVTAFADKNDGTQTAFTIVNTNLAAGQVTISLTAAQVTSLGAGTHHYYVYYTNGTIARRAAAGDFVVFQY